MRLRMRSAERSLSPQWPRIDPVHDESDDLRAEAGRLRGNELFAAGGGISRLGPPAADNGLRSPWLRTDDFNVDDQSPHGFPDWLADRRWGSQRRTGTRRHARAGIDRDGDCRAA